MKRLSMLVALAVTLALSNCADPVEQRSAGEVEGQIQRGVTGQGTIGPIDRPEGDQAAEHSVPQTHP
jgi:hypothetical protein